LNSVNLQHVSFGEYTFQLKVSCTKKQHTNKETERENKITKIAHC